MEPANLTTELLIAEVEIATEGRCITQEAIADRFNGESMTLPQVC
jgi:hypothetical protein